MTDNGFFHWWLRQLAALVPASIRRSLQARGRSATLVIERDRLSLQPTVAAEPIVAELPSSPGSGLPANPALRAAIPDSLKSLRVRLAPHEFLVRQLTLPAAARAHLAEAVGYQLPKLTPFNASQVRYACGIDGESSGDGTLNVWLVAVPRRRLDAALQMLGLNIPESAIALNAPPGPGEPLEFRWRIAPKSMVAGRGPQLIWIGALAVWTLALGLHLYHVHDTHERLAAELSDLRKQAADVNRLHENLTGIAAKVDWLNAKRQSTVSSLDLLDVLTRELDDDTWLQNFEMKDGKLTLQGLSPAPAGLIEKLEGARLLHNVRFEAAITQDARSNGSRFSISASVNPPTPGEGS